MEYNLGMKPSQRFGWGVALVAIALLLAAAWRWGGSLWSLFRDRAAMQAWIASFGAWAPLVSIALNAAQVILAPIPGQVISWANGYLFGVWLGALYNLVGTMIGTGLVLALTRRWGRPLVSRLIHDRRQLAEVDRLVARQGKLFFLLIFLLPSMPKDLACYAIGLTDLPLGEMLVLIALGRLPGSIVASWVGANAASLSPMEWIALIVGATALALAYLRWRATIENALLKGIERVMHRR
jgi:uncharacterized membrane protein YdjX (TVP38/TMEM64 family)